MGWFCHTCSIVSWCGGNFATDRNKTRGDALLRLQKRFVSLMAGKRGRYHTDPLFARFGVLKVGDLYQQQVRVHAWKFWNGRVGSLHGHAPRSARSGLVVATRDHGFVGYRVSV